MVKVAVMGFGTVGSGVVDVMTENVYNISHNAAETLEVKYILDIRDFSGSPYESMIVRDFGIIESDPEIRVVVETIGGTGIAYEYTKRCLEAGKSVVTSNKELVATKGHELIAIAKAKNANYLFEASVGGGIPIIRPITQCLTANNIDEIYGILNGTTNYILTEMIQCNTSFEDALSQAQAMGIAEQNPAADIEGHDACRKICILSDLCFGRHVNPEEVSTEGISGIESADVSYASSIGYKIKLLGRALRTGQDNITAYVAPHLVSKSSMLSNVDGVMNGIIVHGNAIGEAMFYGPGAGKRPTASAVVADVIDAVKHFHARKFLDWEDGYEGYVTSPDQLSSKWYVRTTAPLSDIGSRFGNVRFIGKPDAPDGEYAFVSERMKGVKVRELLHNLTICSLYRVLD